MGSNNPAYCPCENEEGKTVPGMATLNEYSETSQRLKTFNYLSGITRAAGVLLIILVLAWTGQWRGGFGWHWHTAPKFNWHPMLMTLGMVFLYSDGMLIYRTQRTMGMQRLKVIHAGITLFCIICTIIGLSVGFENKNYAERYQEEPYKGVWDGSWVLLRIPHMYTLHSWVGLTSVILFFFQCTAGLLCFLLPGLKLESHATYMRWHVNLGTGGFVGAVTACILGFNEKAIFAVKEAKDYHSENTMIWFIYLTLIIFGGLSVYLISQDRYKRLARPGDDDPVTKEAVFGNLFSEDEPICCLPWTPNDCARSFRTLFSQPNSNALASVDTHVPPTSPIPPLNNLKDVD